MTFGGTLYRASHTRIWLPISFFIIFQMFSMGFMSREFPGHSSLGIILHSRNV